MPPEPSILQRIVAAKRKRLAHAKLTAPQSRVIRAAEQSQHPPLNFANALESADGIALIAEMKRASPSGGELDPDLDPTQRATTYCEAGASAISVLTELDHFSGTNADLAAAAEVAHPYAVPALQKDFVIDEYQVHEARANGASSILLIIAILDSIQYADLYETATGLGMEPLVEAFDERELDIALTHAEPRVVGINNRNLKTLRTSLDVFPRLARRIPDDIIKVAESGMKNADDVRRMADAGADAVLVGESLMRAGSDPTELVSQMSTVNA